MVDKVKDSLGDPGDRLVGRSIYLRPISSGDYELIRNLELSGDDGINYRHRGVTPSPEQFVQTLWQGVLVQYMIAKKDNGRPIGTVTCYGPDFRNGWAYVAGMLFPGFRRSAWPLESFEIFIGNLFRDFPFRKLYAEVFEPNLESFGSAVGRYAKLEGRLHQHEYLNGAYMDKIILSVSREAWFDPRRLTLSPAKNDQRSSTPPLLQYLQLAQEMHSTNSNGSSLADEPVEKFHE